MKTKITSISFLVLAIVAAFSSHAMSRTSLALVQGYIKGNPNGTICQVSILCSDTGGQLCRVGTTQVWGKDSSGRCILEVYRAPD